jgi:hypothetical protein
MQSKDNHVYIVRRSAKWLKYDTIDDPSFDDPTVNFCWQKKEKNLLKFGLKHLIFLNEKDIAL